MNKTLIIITFFSSFYFNSAHSHHNFAFCAEQGTDGQLYTPYSTSQHRDEKSYANCGKIETWGGMKYNVELTFEEFIKINKRFKNTKYYKLYLEAVANGSQEQKYLAENKTKKKDKKNSNEFDGIYEGSGNNTCLYQMGSKILIKNNYAYIGDGLFQNIDPEGKINNDQFYIPTHFGKMNLKIKGDSIEFVSRRCDGLSYKKTSKNLPILKPFERIYCERSDYENIIFKYGNEDLVCDDKWDTQVSKEKYCEFMKKKRFGGSTGGYYDEKTLCRNANLKEFVISNQIDNEKSESERELELQERLEEERIITPFSKPAF